MMRKRFMAVCGAVLLAGALLGGCSSVASGNVRTTAAVETGQESGTETADMAESAKDNDNDVDQDR